MILALAILFLASPFIGISYFMVRQNGWQMFFEVWGITLAIVIVVAIGATLLTIAIAPK